MSDGNKLSYNSAADVSSHDESMDSQLVINCPDDPIQEVNPPSLQNESPLRVEIPKVERLKSEDNQSVSSEPASPATDVSYL